MKSSLLQQSSTFYFYEDTGYNQSNISIDYWWKRNLLSSIFTL